ncbi:MAG TPA: type VII secretion target [Cellulomonas sp.]
MAGRIRVDTDEITEASALVRRAGHELDEARAAGVPALGHASLESAFGAFGARWTTALECARADVDEFGRRLDATARAYRDTDDEVARLARRLTDSLEPGGTTLGAAP